MSDDDENVEEIDPISDYEPPPKATRGMSARRAVPAVPAENPESPKGKFYNARVRCPYGCNKVLAQRTIDYHRTNGCRMGQEEPFADSNRKKNYCCGVCFAEFVTRPAFLTHMSDEHDVSASVHHLQFPNKNLFMRFVRWLEAEGGAHFRHKSGAKRRASGKGIFMACNRSGYVGRSLTDPIRNKSGNFRTGYTCTGFIHGTEHNNGSISIEFCGDHYGHDARMRLPNVIKQLIAQKQMDGESFVDITSYLRRQFAPLASDCIYAQRVCLVDLDELRTLLVTTTRKWENTGIPLECEIWEEEFLEKAGITREGAPRMRKEGDKSTEELAKEFNWPRPHVFTAKMKVGSGVVEIPELKPITAETRRDVSQLQNSTTRTQNANVFRENLKTVTADTAEPDVCVDDDCTSPDLQEKDEQKIDVTTVSSPTRKTPADTQAVRSESKVYEEEKAAVQLEPLKQLAPKPLNSKHLTRSQAISMMIAEMNLLESMIRNDSGNASGTFLVAFMTRIKQLRISYAAGILPANQPMGEQQPRLSNIDENKDTDPRAHTAEDQVHEEEEIADIGTDYTGETDLERHILETVGEGHGYNSLLWN